MNIVDLQQRAAVFHQDYFAGVSGEEVDDWELTLFGTPAEPDLSHDNLALELSRAGFSQDARYVHAVGKWFLFDGSRWVRDDKLGHMTAIREYLRAVADGLERWAEEHAGTDAGRRQAATFIRSLKQAPTVNAVETMARSNADLVATMDLFDADPLLLGTPGGTVDLRTGKLVKARRDHWLTKQTAVTPASPGAAAPLWGRFLNRVFNGDQELIDFLQRAAGYALTGHTREHKLLFLYGTGRNGKSVFLNTLFDVMADYSKRAAAQTFLDSHSERHPTDLAGLHGARLVAGSELPPGKVWNESVIKDLTGGDVITARFMRQDFFDYQPQFTLFIAGNHQPAFRGIDEAIRARVVLVPFTVTIPADERDPELPQKLQEEWPAILRWMVDGAVAWQRQGLAVPDSVKAASLEYLDSEDTLGEFVADNLITAPGCGVTHAAMYKRFTEWQRASGLSNVWSKIAMTKALKERGLQAARGGAGTRGFSDVRLSTMPSDYRAAKNGEF
ncbi:phage/plasmid primase, P4 family [Haliea sp. E1-2-M8]|uniref:phage/plasmid primase, P4 family n=1 Tax=Haliea sp. E1-2-M8 TaxID=3064706 RepID=UPI002715DF07|nr:phage/plasmid primase, P4 family [Haliea sp. E1-2-M8]MDO8864133.1 phage/plasmid primase, P4 family [Haliea sp. E1-2-M8]